MNHVALNESNLDLEQSGSRCLIFDNNLARSMNRTLHKRKHSVRLGDSSIRSCLAPSVSKCALRALIGKDDKNFI